MSSKVAFLSDIHGNSPALRAVLEDIQRERCDKVFMLGDIINGIDPHGCVQALRSWSDTNRVELACIKGNAEAYLVIPDRYSLPRDGEMWDLDILDLIQWWQDRLSPSDLEWIHSMPDTIPWGDMYLVHDSPKDRLAIEARTDIPKQNREWMFHGRGILPNISPADWQSLTEYMSAENLKQIFCGHTHRPFCRADKDYLVCNIGSAGMPLDGDPSPTWAMLDEHEQGNPSVSIRRVPYDISQTLQLVDQTPDYYDFKMPGYQEAYKKMFLTGIPWRAHMPKDETS